MNPSPTAPTPDDQPILVAPLFREVEGWLVESLSSLSADDWFQPTVCSAWQVRDIAAHLLDGALRRVAAQRDGYAPPEARRSFESSADLVGYLHKLNADWTGAARRLSPRVLVDLVALSGAWLCELFESADPFALALYPVGWAGDAQSPAWFDMAREYTERWHHQRQIADAVGRDSPIDDRRLYNPVLRTFVRALPYTFRDVPAQPGTRVQLVIDGPAGDGWFIERHEHGWWLFSGYAPSAQATASIDQNEAWKLFTKKISADDALARFGSIRLSGNVVLARRVLEMVSIMA